MLPCQEAQQDIVRLAHAGGPVQKAAQEMQQKALEAMLERAGLTGEMLRAEANL